MLQESVLKGELVVLQMLFRLWRM